MKLADLIRENENKLIDIISKKYSGIYRNVDGTEIFKILKITKYEYGIEIWFEVDDYHNNHLAQLCLDSFRKKLYYELREHYGVIGQIVSKYVDPEGNPYY